MKLDEAFTAFQIQQRATVAILTGQINTNRVLFTTWLKQKNALMISKFQPILHAKPLIRAVPSGIKTYLYAYQHFCMLKHFFYKCQLPSILQDSSD